MTKRKRKPITIQTSSTELLISAPNLYPGAVVYTGAGMLLVLVTGEDEICVRTLVAGDEKLLGGEPILNDFFYLNVNGVDLKGKISLRPHGWSMTGDPSSLCSFGRNRVDEKGWIQRRYDGLRFSRNEYGWTARGKASESAKTQIRDLCERAAAHVLRNFPGLLVTGNILELKNEIDRVGGKLDAAYLRIDELTDEYADLQEKIGQLRTKP